MNQPTTKRVIVDPVTRIEGHLRIEAETDASGRITRASSAGTMVRGIEIILRGATRAMPGPSRSVSAAYVRWCMASLRCARSRTRSTSKCPAMPS